VAGPVNEWLRQGLTPEGLALSLAFGLAAGVFPVIGATTLLAFVVGVAFRLNHPALQLANWLAYPAQLALILPFVRLGEWISGAPRASLAVPVVVDRFVADPFGALGAFGLTGMHGVLGWFAVVPIAVPALFGLLLPGLRAARSRTSWEGVGSTPAEGLGER